MRRSIATLILTLAAGVGVADGHPTADQPCVERLDDHGREVAALAADARGVQFCTGDDCWRLETGTFASIDKPAEVPEPVDSRVKVDDGERPAKVTFCPTASTCKSFKLGIKVDAVEAPTAMMNVDGTLGALHYTGVPEKGFPVWNRLYDLRTGKQIKELRSGFVEVVGDTFVAGQKVISAKGKVLATIPKDLVLVTASADKGLIVAGSPTGQLRLIDTHTGAVKWKLALALTLPAGVDKSMLGSLSFAFSPDATTLYAVTGFPIEGDTFVIDVATGKLARELAPTACAADHQRPS